MNERLGQFMREENMTAAKLAEILQIQPSSISHLLSGRNKPNFDFIARILRMFAELNPDWLINGYGSMYRSQNASSTVNEDKSVKNETVVTDYDKPNLDAEIDVVTLNTDVTQTDLFTTHENDFEQVIATENSPVIDIKENQADNLTKCDVKVKHQQDEIDKIIVFYSDQTFSIYNQR